MKTCCKVICLLSESRLYFYFWLERIVFGLIVLSFNWLLDFQISSLISLLLSGCGKAFIMTELSDLSKDTKRDENGND